jgi:hypothetical protein
MRTDNPVFLQKYTELAKEDRDRYKRETRGEFTHAPRTSTPAHPLPPLVASLRYFPIKTTAAQRQEARDMMKATGNTPDPVSMLCSCNQTEYIRMAYASGIGRDVIYYCV